jgi:hypothetical protein
VVTNGVTKVFGLCCRPYRAKVSAGVTVVLQWCFDGVTVMLQCFYAADHTERKSSMACMCMCVRARVCVCMCVCVCVCVCMCVCLLPTRQSIEEAKSATQNTACACVVCVYVCLCA